MKKFFLVFILSLFTSTSLFAEYILEPANCTFKKKINYARLNRIMVSGIKQSGNPFVPVLNFEQSFNDYINDISIV